MNVYEATLETRAIVGRGARGLTAQGEQELIQRVVDGALSVTGQEVERLARRVSFRTAMWFGVAGVVLIVAGYLWGYWHGYCDARHGVCSLAGWWKR